jgi:TatD DNase family protein
VTEWIEKHGESINHIAYRVDNIDEKLKELAANDKVAAMSEIGLDYRGRRDRETAKMGTPPLDKQIQLNAFRGQLRLAKELNLPVVIHDNTPEQEAQPGDE